MSPKRHEFAFPLWLAWLDLDDIPALLGRHPLWGTRWRSVTFRSTDFFDPEDSRPLAEKARECATSAGLNWDTGHIYLLAQLRTFGVLFNPLSLYWHIPEGQDRPDSVLAEVHNTPWNEWHAYAIPLDWQGNVAESSHDKTFHVSPFMPLDQRYHWRFIWDETTLKIRISNFQQQQCIFHAGLNLTAKEADRRELGRVIKRYGPQSLMTLWGIYWQALKLFCKRLPFYGHS